MRTRSYPFVAHVCRALALATAVCAVYSPVALRAQESDARVGVDGTAGVASISTSVPIYAGNADCGAFTSGYATSFGAGLWLKMPELLGSAGASIRIGYSSSAASFTTAPIDALVIYDAESDTTIDIPREYALDVRDGRADVTIAVDARPWPRWTMTVGGRVSYRLSSSVSQVERITGGDRTYTDGESERALQSPTDVTPTALAFGMLASAGYRIDVGPRLAVEPTIGIDIAPLSSMRNLEWIEYRAYLSLPFTFSLRASDEASVAPQPPIAAAAAPSRLDASIVLQSLDASGAVAHVASVALYETVERSRVDLSPRIEFAANSAVLPRQYLGSSGREMDFDSAAIADSRALSLRALDIVGWRLHRNPEARVILAPSTASGEPSWLSFARAESVRAYLEEQWSVERARIEIRPGARRRGSGASARVVDLIGVPGSLLGSFVAEKTSRAAEPPLLQLKPAFFASAGVASAEVVVLHDAKQIRRLDARTPTAEADIDWQIVPDRIGATSHLHAELHVEAEDGRDTLVAASIPLRLIRHERSVERSLSRDGATQHTVATLFASEPVTSRHNLDAVASILAGLRPGARIVVDGDAELLKQVRDRVAAMSVPNVGVSAAKGSAGASRGRITIDQPAR